MKTPDKIKKGLEYCSCAKGCKCGPECPYDTNEGISVNCIQNLTSDALAYIKQLEDGIDRVYKQMEMLRGLPEKIEQLERERDAAVADLENKSFGCEKCKHYMVSSGKICALPIEKRKPSFMCWQWRGAQKEGL